MAFVNFILLVFAFFGVGVSLLWMLHYMTPEKKRTRVARRELPRLAVAIPAHNEEEVIATTIRSVLRAGMQKSDIFVLCNGCTDKTAEKVGELGILPIIASPEIKGKGNTLNYAIKKLQLFRNYTHVCLFDADTLMDPSYFRIVREKLKEDEQIDIVCGGTKSLRHNWLTAYRAVQYTWSHVINKSAQARRGAISVIPGCVGTYSVKSLQHIVWRSSTPTEDMDATIQANLMGFKIAFEPRAIAHTQDPATLRDYWNQMYGRWIRGMWMNLRLHNLLFTGWFSALHWQARIAIMDPFLPILGWGIALYYAQTREWPWAMILGVYALFQGLRVTLCVYMEKRWDVVKYVPLFPILEMCDFLIFFATSWAYFATPRGREEWTSPRRRAMGDLENSKV